MAVDVAPNPSVATADGGAPAANAAHILDVVPDHAQFIGGEWVPAKNGETIDVLNPATGEVLRRVPRGRAEDIDAAVQAARSAFPAWCNLDPTRRGQLLRRWGDLCNAHGVEIGILESLEVGKIYRGPSTVGDRAIYVAGLADKLQGATLPTTRPGLLAFTLREPYGVCGSIVPWNFPPSLMMDDVAPAIAAGNTIVVKPAEDAPLSCLLLAKLAAEAGIPAGVINVVTGYGAEAGAALPQHPGVRHMSFTGSPETGALVMAACAKNLVPLHLELGGKSPQIILGDADLDQAVPVIVRQLTNATGQVCMAGTRLLVDEAIRPRIVDAVAQALRQVRVGHWYEDVDMGPLISAKQERRVLGYLGIGKDEGAAVVTGGHKLAGDHFERGFFVEPTLLDHVTPSMRVAQEEIFGPVLAVLPFRALDEALDIANGTKYGLAASVWTRDVRRAVQVAKGFEAGQVYVNQYGSAGAIGAPFGGYKHSGFGRTRGADSVLEYTQVKTVIINATE